MEITMKILAKDRQITPKLSQSVLTGVMFFLLFAKCLHLYSNIGLGGFEIPLAAVSVGIIALIYGLIVPFSPKAAFITLTVLYTLSSVIFSVDMVYYVYMGSLPSFGMLRMAWQLGGVTGTLSELIDHAKLLPLFDLPLWFLWAVNTHICKNFRMKRTTWKMPLRVVTCVLIACAILFAQYATLGNFKLSYLPNEIFTQHAKDLIDTLSPNLGATDVDKSKYTAESQADNPYYGIAEGRNVFVIQVEALQEFVIGTDYKGETITPFLNSLIENDSFYFENYFYQVGAGNTSDAEFAVNNSLYPSTDGSSYEKYTQNKFAGLPWLLKSNGYKETTAFHAYREDFWSRNKAYPYQGFKDFISMEDMEFHPAEGCVFAIDEKIANTDRRLYEDVVETVSKYKEPFYSFIITLSSHNPFAVAPADRYVDSDNPEPNLFNLYVQSAAYVDRTLEEFMDALKKEGLYDNSIFVIYGDHYALSQSDEENGPRVSDMLGRTYNIVDRFKVPMIIHIPGMDKAEKIDTVGAHVDVLPTLLCLLGIDNDQSVMFGHNLLDPDYEGIVYELMHLKAGTFITKDVFYIHSEGGINSMAFDLRGNPIEIKDEYLEIAEEAIKTINDCHALLDADEILLK